MTIAEQKNGKRFSLLKLTTVLRSFGLDGFLFALLGMIALAYIFPAPGLAKEPVSLEELTNCGLSLIFFFYGLRLNFTQLRTGLKNWRMHILIQLTTFLFFPLILLLAKPFFGSTETPLLWLGSFYLATLPSTVSSSVVMVSIAGGNLPAAIFNASVSSFLGVFITPLWMSLFLAGNAQDFDVRSIFLKLFVQVLLPFGLGIALNRYFGGFAEQHKKKLRYFDQTIILLIVYTAFCHSFELNTFADYSLLDLLLLTLAMILLFFGSYAFIYSVTGLLKFNGADTVTVLFCGSKKSLVHGTIMSKVLFPDASLAGVLLLPIMVYHAIQLIFASIIARRIAHRINQPAAEKML